MYGDPICTSPGRRAVAGRARRVAQRSLSGLSLAPRGPLHIACISARPPQPGSSGVWNLAGVCKGISQWPTLVSERSPVRTAYSKMPMYLDDSLPAQPTGTLLTNDKPLQRTQLKVEQLSWHIVAG